MLQAGAVIDVRVLRILDAGRFLVALGNRQLVAESEAELKPGSQVRMKVAAASPDGLVLRLAAPVTASLSDATRRLTSARLPNTPAAAAVLAAFEEAGAPLVPARLQAALADVTRAQAPPQTATAHALLARADLPVTPALIRLATRAASGTLPSLGTALRDLSATAEPMAAEAEPAPSTEPPAPERRPQHASATPSPPDSRRPALPAASPAPASQPQIRAPTDQPMARISAIVPAPPTLQSAAPSAATPAVPAPPVDAPRLRPAIPHAPLTPQAEQQARPDGQPAWQRRAAQAGAIDSPPDSSPKPTRPGSPPAPASPSHPPAPPDHPVARIIAAAAVQPPARSTAQDAPAATSQQPAARSQQPTANSQQPNANGQQPTANSQQPTANSQQPTPPNRQPAPATTLPVVLPRPVASSAPATPTSAAPPPVAPTPTPPRPEPITLRQLADLVLPDPARDGAPAVLRALHLAGVRPATSPLPAATMPVLPTATVVALLPGSTRQITAELPAATTPAAAPADPARASESPAAPTATPRPELPAAPPLVRQEPASPAVPQQPSTQPELLEQSAARAMREHLADQVFKPKDLADYDRVVALPLAANDLPTPARLAVATRSTGGGVQATFLRVDAELSRLGNVSIRLSGADNGGPMAITLVAAPHAGALLAEELPALVADLRALGVDAGVRVVADG